jgi:hypothetical protein
MASTAKAHGTFDGVMTLASALKMIGAGVAVVPGCDMSEFARTVIVMSRFGKYASWELNPGSSPS